MIGKSSSGAILSKSSTLVEQTGNEMPRFIKDIDLGPGSSGSINSEGLPNKGCDYYISDEALESLSKFKKPYIVSISGLKLEDNGEMIKRVLAQRKKHNGTGIDGVELNLACPNIPGKPTQAYDFEQMDKSLSYMTDILRASGDRITFGIKLAPYFDKLHCATAADIILQVSNVRVGREGREGCAIDNDGRLFVCCTIILTSPNTLTSSSFYKTYINHNTK